MRVVEYCRVSTEEQARHGISIDQQIDALDKWVEQHPDAVLVNRYIDEGHSAWQPASKRKVLQDLLRDAEAGAFDLIIFTMLDRWFRSVSEYHKTQAILDAAGVAWRATQEDYDTQTPDGTLKVNIMLSVAQNESDKKSARLKKIMEYKREKGEVCSGRVPFGIEIVDKRLRPSEDAHKAAEFFQYYISTRSIRKAALASEAILGRRMSYYGTSHMLENPRYAELGIIDAATWELVQKIRADGANRLPKTDRVYLFSGLIRCGDCGGRYVGHINRQPSGEYIYYRCRTAMVEATCRNVRTISERKLERYLLEHTVDQCRSYNLSVMKAAKRQKPAVDVAAVKRRMAKLEDMYLNDLIDRDRYEQQYRECQTQLEKAEPPKKKTIDVAQIETALSAYVTLSPAGRKDFWGRIIDTITISESGDISFTLLCL